MQSHPVHKVINSYCILVLELLKKHIQGNDSAGPPYSSAGMQDTAKVRLVCRSSSAVSKGKRGVWIQLMVYLQWTTVGADDTCLSMCCLTSPLNWIRISVFSGTPWSGQTVKWKCLTLHSSQVSLCEHTVIKLVLLSYFVCVFGH